MARAQEVSNTRMLWSVDSKAPIQTQKFTVSGRAGKGCENSLVIILGIKGSFSWFWSKYSDKEHVTPKACLSESTNSMQILLIPGILFHFSLNWGDRGNGGAQNDPWADSLLPSLSSCLHSSSSYFPWTGTGSWRCSGRVQLIMNKKKRAVCFHMYWDQLPKASQDPRHPLVQWPRSISQLLCHSPGSCTSSALGPVYHVS